MSAINIYFFEGTIHFFYRTIGKASLEMRLYFCAPKSCLGDLSSGLLHSAEAVYPEGSLNKRGSYLSGQLIYGDAILASIGYKWKSSDLFYEDVSLRTYYRSCLDSFVMHCPYALFNCLRSENRLHLLYLNTMLDLHVLFWMRK